MGLQKRDNLIMKVLHISPDEDGGGAAKAAYRIHCALKGSKIQSQMLVINKQTNDESVISINNSLFQILRNKLYKRINKKIIKKNSNFHTENQTLHSFGLTGYNLSNWINQSDADIIHLHWIIGMLSIEDIGKITKPIVWTLHDMWPFCGGEHYVPDDSSESRFRAGYLQSNRPSYEIGEDLNQITWNTKYSAWKNHQFSIVGTSNWLKQCAQDSLLFKDNSQFFKIALPIDIKKIWKPHDKNLSRDHFNLPKDKKIILAGAVGGVNNFYKGGDLLQKALEHLSGHEKTDVEIVLFGQDHSNTFPDWPLPVHNIGKISNPIEMAKLYSCADVVVVPSRQEAFGQIASEAQACGLPVAAFRIGGPIDIVAHKETGWLAQPYDVADLALGISWILKNPENIDLRTTSRARAVELFSPEIIAQQYQDAYQKTLEN